MKTVLINGRFLTRNVSGVQRYAREMTAAMRRLAPRDLRFVLAAPPGALLHPPGDMEIVQDAGFFRGVLWEQVRLPRMMRRLGADLLWSPCNTGPLGVRRQVVTIHDAAVFAGPEWFSWSFGSWYRWLLPRLGRSVAKVVTDSRFSADELARYGVVVPERVTVVPAGVSHAVFHPRPGPPEGGSYVLCVASRDPRKNFRRLLEAWKAASSDAKQGTVLVIAGERSRSFASEDLEPAPDVRWMGSIFDDGLAALYAGAKAFVYPSLYEGFGLPPLESMAVGTPVVASDIPPLKDLCGDAVLYCRPLDVDDIRLRIESLLGDEALRQRLRGKGLERASGFGWDRAAAQLLDRIVELL